MFCSSVYGLSWGRFYTPSKIVSILQLNFDVLKSYLHSSLSNLKTDLHLPLVPIVESKLLNSIHEYILIKGQDLLALLFFVVVLWPHYMACGILIAYSE